ncbi:hypothetical protein Golax_021055, partial [Gossypium laxum]|nr:hypothetical protein [Gossypium laxum]
MSDGNILCGTDSPMSASNVRQESENRGEAISESTHEMPAYGISYSRCVLTVSCFPSFQIAVVGMAPSIARFTPRMSCRQLFGEIEDQFLGSNRICYENGDECNCTNFDMDWLSSSGNSCDDDVYDRSAAGLSSENIGAELKTGMTTSPSESGSNIKVGERSASEVTCDGLMDEYSESFVNWVTHGDLLIP